MSHLKCVRNNSLLFLTVSVIFFVLPAMRVFSADAQVAILKAILNAEDMGELFVVITPDKDVWIKKEDLARTRLKGGLGREVIYDGEAYVSLRSIPGIGFEIDEKEASIGINAPPGLFAGQTLDASYRPPRNVVYTKDDSAFLNYGFFYDSLKPSYDLSTELGVRFGDYFADSTFDYLNTPQDDRFVRLLTYVTTDDRKAMKTLTFGDFTAASGVMGTTAMLGGINFTRNFSVDPYFLRYPSLSLSGAVETPSEAAVYVDGILVRRERLLPGAFQLRDIPTNVGLGIAEVVIKDVYGRERTVSEPFFYSDRLLKKGLHEYSYGAGFLREDLGARSFAYGSPAFLAFHNYGFTERLKGGYALEASDRVVNIGPTASLLMGRAGVLDAAVAMSASKGKGGFGGFLGYSFRSRSVNVSLAAKALSGEFSSVSLGVKADRPSFQMTGAIGYGNRRLGSVSAGYSTTSMREGVDTRTYTVSYNRGMPGGITFFAIAGRTEASDARASDEFFVGINKYFSRDVSGELGFTDRDGSVVKKASMQKKAPAGTGWGLRGTAEDYADSTDGQGDVQYQNDYGVYDAGYRKVADEESYILSASGGIGYIGRSLFLSRPIYDSFARVRVGDVEGVRVYYFGNEVGRTDREGTVIIPTMHSFNDNRIDIEKDDIPIEYGITALTKYLNPPLRSGSCVDFAVSRYQAYTGRLLVKDAEGRRPLPFREITITTAAGSGRELETQTSSSGEFYIERRETREPRADELAEQRACAFTGEGEGVYEAGERIQPGTYKASAGYNGSTCGFDLTIPESDEMFVDIGDFVCEPRP